MTSLGAKLTSQETLFARLFEFLPDASLLFDHNGQIVVANRKSSSLFGHSLASLRSMSLDTLLSPDSYEQLKKHKILLTDPVTTDFQSEVDENNSRCLLLTALTEAGEEIPVEVTLSSLPPARPSSVQETRILATFRDVSRQKARESELVAKISEAESLVHSSAHDLKAPLRAIRNASGWLSEDLAVGDPLGEKDLVNLQLIQTRVARLEKLIDALEEYYRLGTRKDTRYNEVINAQTMIEEIESALNSNDDFQLLTEGNLEHSHFYRMPLQSVLFKLVDNAIKHSQNGDPRVSIALSEDTEFYRIAVEDNGPGIAPEFQSRIFEPMQTLLPKDLVEGSGMGLAIAKRVLTEYKGTIDLLSEPGNGSTFVITWPKSACPNPGDAPE